MTRGLESQRTATPWHSEGIVFCEGGPVAWRYSMPLLDRYLRLVAEAERGALPRTSVYSTLLRENTDMKVMAVLAEARSLGLTVSNGWSPDVLTAAGRRRAKSLSAQDRPVPEPSE